MQSNIRRRALASAYLSSASLGVRAESSSFLPLALSFETKSRRSSFSNTARRSFWSSTEGSQKSETTDKQDDGTNTQGESQQQSSETQTPQQQQQQDQQQQQPETPEQKKIKDLEGMVASLKDDYLRCLADQQNLTRRTKIDVDNAKLYGIKGFATSILEIADTLERALATVDPSKKSKIPELENLYNGIEMTEKILIKILEKHGVSKFTPVGEKFNPAQHEALFEVQDPSKAPGTVAVVQAAGYSLNGRLLRPAQVGVVASPPGTPPTVPSSSP